MDLPVLEVLNAIKAALAHSSTLVLIAPPGAGKTTAVAPLLLDQPWCTGQILLLSPRRLAARAAAERMADLAGEAVGQTIGYATRMDSRQSSATQILVLTEGIFRNRIQADPELAGVSAVLFDEVHERNLDSDFGLALALDAQSAFRPDLRLIAMSATLDGARFADAMGGAPIIESQGRSDPLTLRHIGRKADARIEDEMASAIRRALGEEDGDILAFLPGLAEIERTADRLAGVNAEIHPLHGTLDAASQRAAIRKGTDRKIVLATSIAETSLTIDGVRIVVDSGLARRALYDRAAGSTQLVTQRVSRAAATQRAGRAARQAPGVAYRLWEEAATAGLPPYDSPEILQADLSALVLDCAIWGVSDPAALRWIDPPPAAAVSEARARLRELDAIDPDDRPTRHGRAMARLPLPPRLAHMLITAAGMGIGSTAAEMAVLISERGLGGNDPDLETRRDRWKRDRGQRADASRGLARRWRGLVAGGDSGHTENRHDAIAICVALAFPDRIARRRGASGEYWASTGGRGYRLDAAHHLARSEWLAVADVQGAAGGARITAAAAIEPSTVEQLFADRIETENSARFDPATRRIEAQTGRRLGAIILTQGGSVSLSADTIANALIEGVRTHGLTMLNFRGAPALLRARASFAGIDTLTDNALMTRLDDWLPPIVAGKRDLDEIASGALHDALAALLDWNERKTIDARAPAEFSSPAGTRHAIDYGAESPAVTLRVQAVFGLDCHPVVGVNDMPLILSLTSPAGRPIQTTRDLPGFWRGSWADVAKDMRGAYPRHNWPDRPWEATASLKTKKALARNRGIGD